MRIAIPMITKWYTMVSTTENTSWTPASPNIKIHTNTDSGTSITCAAMPLNPRLVSTMADTRKTSITTMPNTVLPAPESF